jgi:hypothetical protein
MSVFEILARYSDTCGNSTYQHYDYIEADSIDEVVDIFPRGFLCGWYVAPITINPLPEQTPPFPKERP